MPDPRNARSPVYADLCLGDYACAGDYRIRRTRGSRNWLLFATAEGAGQLAHTDGVLACRPGSLAVIAPDVPHDYGADPTSGRWVFAWAHFKLIGDWLGLVDWPEALPGIRLRPVMPSPVFQQVLFLVRAAAALDEKGGYFSREMARLRFHEALLMAAQAEPGAAGPQGGFRWRRICDHLARHLAEPHSVASLAARAGLSAPRFAHGFSAAVGQSPMAYLEGLRLQAAARRLERPGSRITEVARAVGFTNAGHFATRFRRWSGMTPREWQGRPGV